MKLETLNGEFISKCCWIQCLANCILKPISGSLPHNLSFSQLPCYAWIWRQVCVYNTAPDWQGCYFMYDSEFIFIYKRISSPFLFLGEFSSLLNNTVYFMKMKDQNDVKSTVFCLVEDVRRIRYGPGLSAPGEMIPRESPGLRSPALHSTFGTNSTPSSKFLWLSKTLEHPESAQQCQESHLAGFPPGFPPLRRISVSAIFPESRDLLLGAFFKIFRGPGQIPSCHDMLWIE